MSVSVYFNERAVKEQVNQIITKMIESIKDNPALLKEIDDLYYTYLIRLSTMPEDTGALKGIGTGYGRSGYERIPSIVTGGHHGVEFNPYEIRPNGYKYYAAPVLRSIYGRNVSQGMQDALKSEGLWEDFCIDAALIIEEYMKNG